MADQTMRVRRRAPARETGPTTNGAVGAVGVVVGTVVLVIGSPGSGLVPRASGAEAEAAPGTGTAAAAVDPGAGTRTAPGAPEPGPDMTLIYATAVRELLVGGDETGGHRGVVYVMKRFCPDPAASPPPMRCDGALLPPDLRWTIRTIVQGRADISYITDGQSVTLPDLSIRNRGTVLSLGRARFTGADVLVPMATRSGPLAGMGLTYRLACRGGKWTVTEKKYGWIS